MKKLIFITRYPRAWLRPQLAVLFSALLFLPLSLQSHAANQTSEATLNETSLNKNVKSQKLKDIRRQGLLRIYRSNILKKTYKHIIYPESAIKNDHEGIVVLKLTVDRTGTVTKIDYEARAEYNSLNKAAYRAVKRAMPFPAVPKQVDGEVFELRMPIKFGLKS